MRGLRAVGAALLAGVLAGAVSVPASAAAPFDLESARIPASCGHPVSRLHDGVKRFGSRPDGSSRGDASLVTRTYSTAIPVRDPISATQAAPGPQVVAVAAPIRCSAGGVDYPQTLVLYGRTGAILASRRLDSGREHAAVTAVTLRDTHVRVHWDAYDGAGFHLRHLAATFTLRNGRLVRSAFVQERRTH